MVTKNDLAELLALRLNEMLLSNFSKTFSALSNLSQWTITYHTESPAVQPKTKSRCQQHSRTPAIGQAYILGQLNTGYL